VAIADANIAVWDAKYTWWTERPITADPKIVTAFPTPAYPAYPAYPVCPLVGPAPYYCR